MKINEDQAEIIIDSLAQRVERLRDDVMRAGSSLKGDAREAATLVSEVDKLRTWLGISPPTKSGMHSGTVEACRVMEMIRIEVGRLRFEPQNGAQVDLDALEGLMSQATVGPWIPDGEHRHTIIAPNADHSRGYAGALVAESVGAESSAGDAEFICALRNMVPRLVYELRRLRAHDESPNGCPDHDEAPPRRTRELTHDTIIGIPDVSTKDGSVIAHYRVVAIRSDDGKIDPRLAVLQKAVLKDGKWLAATDATIEVTLENLVHIRAIHTDGAPVDLCARCELDYRGFTEFPTLLAHTHGIDCNDIPF